MKIKAILLATAMSAALVGAAQSRNTGWYISGEVGASFIDDTDATIDSFYGPGPIDMIAPAEALIPLGGYSFDTDVNFDTGLAAFASIGYAFQNNFRVELEAGFRTNDFDYDVYYPEIRGEAIALDFPGYTVDGTLQELTVMANVLYDISLTEKLTLSLGVGAGVDRAELQSDFGPDLDDWNFAAQGIVELSYAIGKRTDLTLAYRYLWVDAPNFDAGFEQVNFDDLSKHAVTIGLRFDLGEEEAPLPPAPPPPPPAAGPKQFVVFFGFNKSNLTGEAQDVISEAANAAKTYGSASIVVVGHTDTVGSNGYNQRLSQRRAAVVKEALVAQGISAGSISASGRGESELLVQTGDNVKEPQNRRTTIDLD